MNKILFLLTIAVFTLNAGLINSVAIIVNNDAITSIDIDNKMQEARLNKKDAVSVLIEEMLYKQSLENLNVNVDDFDINNYIEQLAAQNKMNIFEFKNAVKQQQKFEDFRQDLRQRLTHEKLISKIASNKIIKANDDDMKIYFNNNSHEFNLASKVDARVYISKNKNILNKIKVNPMMLSKEVSVQNVTLENSQLNPKISYILSKTDDNDFSSIFVNNKAYNMFYVIKKYDVKTISFEEAKDKIFEKIMKTRQDEYLKNYFETLKITAKIKVL